MTKTKLELNRKQELKPSITYDLDGDGVVGGKDLVISKKFDEGKGYLTTQDKEKAIAAIKNGYEKNFKWGIEQTGTLGAYRVIQKWGHIIDAEDFWGLENTYPEFP